MDINNKKEFLDRLKQEIEIRNLSKKTLKSYLSALNQFLNNLKSNELNQQIVKDYIQEKISKKDPSSISHDIFAIQFFFDKVLNQKIYLPRPKRNKTIPKILTKEEVKAMISATNNIKHKLILKMLYGCGLRVSEIVNLKKEDINFEEDLIHIRLAKGKKDRFVKIPESLKENLQNYYNLKLRSRKLKNIHLLQDDFRHRKSQTDLSSHYRIKLDSCIA